VRDGVTAGTLDSSYGGMLPAVRHCLLSVSHDQECCSPAACVPAVALHACVVWRLAVAGLVALPAFHLDSVLACSLQSDVTTCAATALLK
jgi:hypothetical protein